MEEVTQTPNKRKNILKRIYKILWFIIWLGFVRFFVLYIFSVLDWYVLSLSDWLILSLSSCITMIFLLLIVFVLILPETNNLRKRIKKFLTISWYVIWLSLGRVFFISLSYFTHKRVSGVFNLNSEQLKLMIILTVVYVLLVLFVLLLIKRYRSKNKKNIKWIVIIWIINLIIIRWWLTKAWVIPNWLWIEALCSCVDCDWKSFSIRQFAQINWKECCEWTYNRIQQDLPPSYGYDPAIARKPIIYLYPTKETEVNVTLWAPENLSHTYPKYNPNNWRNVVAQSNGDLEDIDTWRKLYALYREWITYNVDNFTEWFVVRWEDTISFLEEKLAILWLNEREAEEFIVYWLPQMENNKYNLIRFETKAQQDENMPLNITPTPDTVIRVMMDWKAIDEPIDIPEQELTTPERTWFTVVEWWGSPRN